MERTALAMVDLTILLQYMNKARRPRHCNALSHSVNDVFMYMILENAFDKFTL